MKDNSEIILGLIPARGGSKGVKEKNIYPMLGKPLIAYAIECGLSSSSIDHLLVSTDNEKIADIARRYGADVPFIRPSELAGDEAAMMPVIEHAVISYEDTYQILVRGVVLLDATSPMTLGSDVDNCVRIFNEGKYDAVISAAKARRNPFFNMVTIENGYMKLAIEPSSPISRRQDCPAVYDLNNAIWVFSRKAILEEKSRIPEKSTIYLMDESRAVDVDTEVDLKILETLLKENNHIRKMLKTIAPKERKQEI